MPAGERRDLIARAAGRLFAERGYAGTRLEDVAAAAQVTKPIVYRLSAPRRGSIEEIQAVRRRVSLRAREVLARIIAARAQDSMPRDQIEPTAELLTSGLAGLALWWIDHPELAKPVLVEVVARVSEPAVRGVALSRSV
jgi:AcrR family transcriptional regulator